MTAKWPFPVASDMTPADEHVTSAIIASKPAIKFAAKPMAKFAKPAIKLASKPASKPMAKFAKPAIKVAAKPAIKVARKPANHRAAWDAFADRQLILSYLAGNTPAAIAKECGRTKASIAGRLHSLGLLIFDNTTLTYSTATKPWYQV